MQSQDGNETLSSAETAFIEFLSKRGTDEGVDFEALCAARPDVEEELRAIYGDWAHLDRLIAAGSGRDDLRRKLERHFGASIDECVDLHADSSYDVVEGEVLRRLSAHSPNVTRYQPRGKIADGGMSDILRVWDQDLRRTLAMKVMRSAERSTNPGSRQRSQARVLARFLEEAQITGQLDHPGILPVHELGVDNEGHVFFTMPLVRGRELKEVIELARAESEGWNLRRVLGVLVKVCEATGYAHSKGVIHRDLKPSNVMVGRFGETYVMDWGLARIIGRRDAHAVRVPVNLEPLSQEISTDRSHAKEVTPGAQYKTREGIVIGTPAYMSPEQARGEIDSLDPRSDVYSIGATLYQLLTGRMPYAKHSTDTAQVILARVLEGPPVRVHDLDPGVPEELSAICEKAMAREPDRRYVDALELARDIEAYLGLRPVAAREPALAYSLRLFYARNRTPVLTSLVALLLLAVWGAFYQVQRSAEQAARQERVDRDAAQVLVNDESKLYPAVPAVVTKLDQWAARAEDLLARAEDYQPRSNPEPEYADFLGNLTRLEGLLPRVRSRRQLALSLPERTITNQRARWDEARASIRSSPLYANMDLQPQLGLVPLQQHPTTGLWEFWLEPTGAEPVIEDVRTGKLRLDEDSAVVLVLLPAGTFTMGQSEEEREWVGYRACEDQKSQQVAAFFLGKYETTQAQWVRLMGENPARYQPGYRDRPIADEAEPGDRYTEMNPIERITYFESKRFAERVGCRLPTSEEWEYACRAGTRTAFCWGADPSELEEHENISDQSHAYVLFSEPAVPWNDGYPEHAPVGTFAANAFGLYDMHGNVAEWCDSDFVNCNLPDQRPDSKVIRGGAWYMPPRFCGAGFVQGDSPRGCMQGRGMRLARSID